MDTVKPAAVFDLEYFFELSPDLLIIAGYDRYFKKINPAVSKTLGYTDDELLASPIISFVHPDDREITLKTRKETGEEPLTNFENRYLTKSGAIVWLSWTSMPIKRDRLVFAIAKNITYKKQLEEYDRISAILGMINDDRNRRFKKTQHTGAYKPSVPIRYEENKWKNGEPSKSDQNWLNSFEMIVRKYTGRLGLNLNLIGDELAVSERQLFRQVDRILGITPNKFVRIVRLQLAWEAIASGKYRTITEISNIAGYR